MLAGYNACSRGPLVSQRISSDAKLTTRLRRELFAKESGRAGVARLRQAAAIGQAGGAGRRGLRPRAELVLRRHSPPALMVVPTSSVAAAMIAGLYARSLSFARLWPPCPPRRSRQRTGWGGGSARPCRARGSPSLASSLSRLRCCSLSLSLSLSLSGLHSAHGTKNRRARDRRDRRGSHATHARLQVANFLRHTV